jgi:ketosteroid isomerase-like protein
MSQENVDTLRAVYEEWARGNFAAGGDLWDQRVVFIPIAELPGLGGAGEYVGPEEINNFMQEWLDAWTDFTVTATEFIEAGDSVVVATRQRAAGQGSGTPTEFRYFQVWTFRGRAVTRYEFFRERAEALAAAGLSE